jgi:hypothetical protein
MRAKFLSIVAVVFVVMLCPKGRTNQAREGLAAAPSVAQLNPLSLTQAGRTERQPLQQKQQAKPVQPAPSSQTALAKRIAALEKEVKRLRAKAQGLEKQVSNLQRPKIAPAGDVVGFRKAKDGKYVLAVNGARIEIDRQGAVTIKASKRLLLESPVDTSIKAGTALRLEAGAGMTAKSAALMRLESSSTMDVKAVATMQLRAPGGLRLNQGTRPAAAVGDPVTGICGPPGGALNNGRILPKPSDAQVLIP